MKDIETREDILMIMQKFYDKLLTEDSINFFFSKVTSVDKHLEEHFEILVTFWEQSLFMKGGYFNNMFQIHKDVHEKHPIKKEHYDLWLNYFYETIDKHFSGKNAEQMKTQALSMATIMQIKFSQ